MGLKERVSEWWKNLHIGRGSGEAFLRGGLDEVRNAIFPSSNVSRATPGGMYGTATGIEITEQRDVPTTEALQSKVQDLYGAQPQKSRVRVIGE
ncbi:MAG: hypothetical protein ACJ8C4_07025 [Gemmataceae bacterium]